MEICTPWFPIEGSIYVFDKTMESWRSSCKLIFLEIFLHIWRFFGDFYCNLNIYGDFLGSKFLYFSKLPTLTLDIHNPGYFLPILGLFWAIIDYLKLNPGYLPPIHRYIVTVSASPPKT